MSKARREVPRLRKDGTRAKVDSVQYLCGVCKEWAGSTHVSVDHIVPVIDVEGGFVDWNIFIARLFCGPENLQVICDTCHDKKTTAERVVRLTKQYVLELDHLQEAFDHGLRMLDTEEQLKILIKETKKQLSKYVAKKKTKGLEPIVRRALEMRASLPS